MRVRGSDESDDLDGMSRREPLNVARQALHRRAYSMRVSQRCALRKNQFS
jgi:hypothetical protein